MAAIDDIVRFKLLAELHGVQSVSAFYFRVTDIVGSPLSLNVAIDWATNYISTFATRLSFAYTVSCVIYTNLTDSSDPELRTTINLPGLDVSNPSHPSDLGLWFTRFGKRQGNNPNTPGDDTGKLIHGRIHQTGFALPVSKIDRYQPNAEFVALREFLRTPALFGVAPDEWELTPSMPYSFNPPTIPVTTDFSDVTDWEIKPRFRRLASRRSILCAG